MRVQILMGSAILCLGMFGATTAMAAAAAGTLGGTTCGDFIKMDATAQASLVTDAAKTDSSLTSNSGSANTNGSTAAATKPATPLTAGQLVAACQAAAPTSTVLDAFSAANGATPAPAK
jgi:hypothetical protein